MNTTTQEKYGIAHDGRGKITGLRGKGTPKDFKPVVLYIIEGRRWFDKINGNTYHSVYITDTHTNKRILSEPMTYGYGDQWKHTAYDALLKAGLVKEEDRFNHEKNRARFHYIQVDVQRKKDL